MRFVPALLKPLDFWHSDEALFLVQRLEQISNDWQNLALATSGYQSWKNANPWSSIEKYIAVCLAKRELLMFKINPVNVKIERLQFNNPYGLSYRFLPAYYRLTHSALPLKRITDLTKAHSLVQSLNLSDKQFNELIETLSISPPASTNTAKPIDLLGKAIISGAVIIHEREAFTTSKPLIEEPLGPNDRPSTMGVEPYDPAKAYQEKQAKANQPIPLSESKRGPPISLDDVVSNSNSLRLDIPTSIRNVKVGDSIPWPDLKPKNSTWNPLPVDGVRRVVRVKGGIRLEMTPDSGTMKRFGLSSNDTLSVKYDLDGYPDFYSVRKGLDGDLLSAIPNNGKVQIDFASLNPSTIASKGRKAAQAEARNIDFARGNAKLAKIDLELAQRAGAFSKNGTVRQGPLTAKQDGKPVYTWHHLEGGQSMVLVDYFIHRLFKHSGGRAAIGG